MTDWPSNVTQIPPNAMNAEARMSELASILAAGLVRLRAAHLSAPVAVSVGTTSLMVIRLVDSGW